MNEVTDQEQVNLIDKARYLAETITIYYGVTHVQKYCSAVAFIYATVLQALVRNEIDITKLELSPELHAEVEVRISEDRYKFWHQSWWLPVLLLISIIPTGAFIGIFYSTIVSVVTPIVVTILVIALYLGFMSSLKTEVEKKRRVLNEYKSSNS